jgi:hypothetical protein
MAELDFARKAGALQPQPRLTGRIVGETGDSLTVQAGGCLAEVPLRHIAQRTIEGEAVELVLTKDAEVVVSALVSVKRGLVADDVFGALVPGILACNCNCNCNCGGSNCNCNCNCTSSIEAIAESQITGQRPFLKRLAGRNP